MRTRQIVAVMLLFTFCAMANADDRKHIVKPRPAGLSAVPFSDAVLVGNTLYIAGHIGLDSKTGMAPANTEEEARMVMDGFKQTVEQAGFTMDDVVTVQVFCTDLKLYETFNSVYKTYFHGDFPARAFIGAGSLLRGGHFEVLGTAIKKGQ